MEQWKQKVLQSIDLMWEEFSVPSNRQMREISSDGLTLKMIYDQNRLDYYKKAIYDPKTCPFDNIDAKEGFPSDNREPCALGQSLVYKINKFPCFDKHIIAFPKEHRERQTIQDLDEITEFVADTKYTGFFNGRGSGAGIPEHAHYQAILHRLPIEDAPTDIIYSDSRCNVEKVIFPTYALCFAWKDYIGKSAVTEAITSFQYPYNLILFSEKICFIPRTQTYSPLIPDWKIAAVELAGLFIPRSKDVFESFTFDDMIQVINDTTITDIKGKLGIENYLLARIKYNNQ